MQVSKRGFTLIEMVVVVAIIGIIASVVLANISTTRARARNANRTESVQVYATSLEQWKNSTGSYFVFARDKSTLQPGTCTLIQATKYLGCTDANVVGFQGGGAGGMTRKGITGTYGDTSVADALVANGFLVRVRLDPFMTDYTSLPDPSALSTDFILTLCTSLGAPADSIRTATEYAIFTKLELQNTTEQALANHHCGGKDTVAAGNGGWNTTVAVYTSPPADQVLTHAQGSRRW